MPCIIELNDADIRVHQGERLLLHCPGVAVIRGDSLEVGDSAAGMTHLHPRHTYNRYWSALSQDPWPAAAGALRHNADLAYQQLLSLHAQAGQPAEVIFAVPGSFSTAQLALLLGISQSCPFSAVGLVDSAVAAVAAVAGPGRYQHLDLQLHQAVLTRIDVRDHAERHSVDVFEGCGILAIHDAAAELISDTFIQQARFDPLHRAETEQSVYDQLPRCLATLQAQPEVMLDIVVGASRQQARLTRDNLVVRLAREYAGILQRLEPDRMVLLSDRAAALPGLSHACVASVPLAADVVRRGCLLHMERIRAPGPNLNFVTRLPALQDAALRMPGSEATTAIQPTTPEPATHLLHGHRSYPLDQRTLYLSARGSVTSTRQPLSSCAVNGNGVDAQITPLSDITIYVDGERLAGARRAVAGDKISFAGSDTVYSLISTVRPDGP